MNMGPNLETNLGWLILNAIKHLNKDPAPAKGCGLRHNFGMLSTIQGGRISSISMYFRFLDRASSNFGTQTSSQHSIKDCHWDSDKVGMCSLWKTITTLASRGEWVMRGNKRQTWMSMVVNHKYAGKHLGLSENKGISNSNDFSSLSPLKWSLWGITDRLEEGIYFPPTPAFFY